MSESEPDPTANVLSHVAAAVTRLDDLRVAYSKLLESELRRTDREAILHEQIASLRATHSKELREIESRNARERQELESKRLDAIRQVDVNAVNTAANQALAAIQTLAATAARDAENLRTSLNSTAQTIAKQLADTVEGITKRIAALEMSSYRGEGKSAVGDPMMVELVQEIKGLRRLQSEGSGRWAGAQILWGLLLGLILAVIGVLAFLRH